jgi:hypothetical protein
MSLPYFKLYKYYPCNENSFSSLKEKSLWLHAADETNDPNECFFLNNENYYKYKIPRSSFAFGALSKKFDIPKMWYKYADQKRGFVIELSLDPSLLQAYNVQKVLYHPFNSTKIEKIQNEYENHSMNEVLKGNTTKPIMENIHEALSVKEGKWKHECEYRVWANMSNRSSKGRYLSYEKSGFELSAVFFGELFDWDENFPKIKELVHPCLTFYKVFENKNTGKIHKKRIIKITRDLKFSYQS